MKNQKITIIPGDGIGPEIMKATLSVLDELKCPFTYEEVLAGEQALAKEGHLLPTKTIKSIKKNKVALKSPLNTPKGEGFTSINVTLRQKFDLYANLRPVKTITKTKSPYDDIDIITVRENTEGMYSGKGQKISEDGEKAEAKSIVTRKGSERIVEFAYKIAQTQNRKKVTLAHKANILKTTSGLFLKTGKLVAQKYPNVQFNDMIMDNVFMQLIINPWQFDVVVTTNLFGDLLSDACAGLVGGLGLAPGANIGDDVAIFEAVHGTAPDIAGQGKANPSALMLSAAMMLDYLNYPEKALLLRDAISYVLNNQKENCTRDVGGEGDLNSFTDAVKDYIKSYSAK